MMPDLQSERPLRVLLLEGDPEDARLFRELLDEGELEAELRSASSLEEGLEDVRSEDPDLLVLDLNVAGSEGLETVRRVARTSPGVPLVVMTGLALLDTATEALSAGADEYLRKDGLTPALLARTLRMAIERHRLQREADRQRDLAEGILQSLPEHIAVLDADGTIRAVNDAWRRFARSGGGDPRGYEEDSYLAVTEEAAAEGDQNAREMVAGLRAVLDGDRDHFSLEYPCHGPEERRWFRVQVTPLRGGRAEGAVVSHVDITERMERDRFLTTLTENLPGVLYRCRNDRDWTMEYVSAGVRELTGHGADQLLGPEGPAYADLIHPADRERVWREVQRAVAEDRPFQLEYRIRTREGEERWVWEQGQAIPGGAERTGHLEGYIVDVTERVAARRKVEEAEEKWSTAIDLAPIGIVISEAETGRFSTVNRAMASMLGYEPGDAIGATADDLDVWVDRGQREELLERLREQGIVRNEEIRLRHRSGEIRQTRTSVRMLELAGEQWLLWTVQDVTEQRRRQTALRESETRYRTLVETMEEATLIFDREGRISYVNAAAEELTGVERSELLGRRYDDPEWHITSPDGEPLPDARLPFRRVMETGEPVRNVEHTFRRPNGTRRVLSVNAAPMGRDEEGPAGVVATFRDITDQKQLERQLEHQALHDPLTGLANRTLFQNRLELALARFHRTRQPMGLLMIDINRFKRINDHLGHTVGDRVLEEVGRRLVSAVRETDTVARWGGDEFAIVLPSLEEPSDIEGLQGRIRERIQTPIRTGRGELEVTVTSGAVVRGREGRARTVQTDSPEELVRFSDIALHRAKHDFPGGFYLFDPADEIDAIPDLRVEQELRRALGESEIEVHYQPIYRLGDGALWGLEALARWRHPDRGLLQPAEFIPVAERTGMIHEIEGAVIRAASTRMVEWGRGRPGAHGDGLRISFNLSARQLRAPELVERIRAWLEEAGYPARLVVIEVTETVLMKAPARVDQLKELGLQVFIDDFGTGYSTFTYLRELNADGLKIDRSFVRDLPGSESDAAIVESMVTLGRQLGLELIAEGIEEEDQLERLREMGCGLGQGFHLGRPVPAGEIDRLLEVRS